MNLSEKKNRKKVILFVLLHVCLLLLAVIFYQEDIYSRKVELSEFNITQEAEAVTGYNEENALVVNATGADMGLVLSGPYISVPKGKYTLIVEYEADAEGVVCEIYSNQVVNSDNSRGKLFAREILPAGANQISISYETDELIKGMEYKFYGNGGGFILKEVINQSEKRFTDAFWLYAVFLMLEGMGYLLLRHCRHNKNGDMEPMFHFGILLALALVSTIPATNDFQTMTMDHMIHYARIDDIAEWMWHFSLRQPVMRLAASEHGGYGYLTPVMYPQLFLYFPAILRLGGCSMLMAYKIFIFFVNLATAGIAFFSFGRILQKEKIPAFLCTALYVMNLYRLIDLYTRGAVGEFLAMAFLPLVLYGMYEIFYGDSHRWYYALLGYTGVLQSHVLTTLMAGLFSVFFFLFAMGRLFRERERLVALAKAAVGTLLCNIWFLIPFLQGSSLDLIISESGSDLALSGAYFSQMFASFVENTGVNQVKGSTANEMPLTVGTVMLFGILAALYYLYRDREKKDRLYRLCAGCLLLGLAALFMASVYFPWTPILATGIGSKFHAIQYTWRFLALGALFLSVTGGIAFYRMVPQGITRQGLEKVMLLLMSVIIFTSFPYMDALIRTDAISKSYSEVTREMDELYLPQAAKGTKDSLDGVLSTGDSCRMEVSNFQRGYGELTADIQLQNVTENSYIDLPLFYYPGYHIADGGGQELPYKQSEKGLIQIAAGDSLNHISVYYTEPVLWRICVVISGGFIIGLAGKAVSNRYKKNR